MLSFPTSSWQSSLVPKPKALSRDPNARAATLIVPRLYLSDFFTASSEKDLVRLGITHVISVIETQPTFPESLSHLHKLHISIADRPDVDILCHLEKTTRFIQEALSESESNKVLVHCFQGVSRSATVVCAYIIATTNMTATDAVAFCQAKRGIVCPNTGFTTQLEVYAKQFYGRHAKVKEEGGGIFKISSGIAERIRQLRRRSKIIED